MKQIDLFSMTPLDALNRLADLQRRISPTSQDDHEIRKAASPCGDAAFEVSVYFRSVTAGPKVVLRGPGNQASDGLPTWEQHIILHRYTRPRQETSVKY